MQYALLIYANNAAYAAMTQEESATLFQGYKTFTQEVMKHGIMKGGEKLQPISSATTVRIRNAQTLITDGPFAETKEHLAGFYLVNCKDLDEALALAAKLPDVNYGSIEVRPIVETSV